MRTSLTARRDADLGYLVRWTFHRDGTALTCHVNARAPLSYDVCIVPHWNVSAAAVETVATPGRALQRHAEIAKQLLECGWRVARRTAS
jgi:hypothetical protein